MGEVYRAYDASHDRVVALKLLARQFAAGEQYQERFRRESRAAARLREPHVIPIHRYGEIDGRLFIDMRLVEGESLAAVLARNGPMSRLRTGLIVEQVASALDAAHADGLVHRDVKLSNVLLTRTPSTGNHDFVYLVDFGISRTLKRPQGASLTESGNDDRHSRVHGPGTVRSRFNRPAGGPLPCEDINGL
jgi:serine/threonine protein kinase